MSVEIRVPRLAESISEATLVEWLKQDGEAVRTDEPVATLETDKAAVEIVADSEGVLRHGRQPGETVLVGDVLGRIEAGANGGVAPAPAAARPAPAAAPAPGTGVPARARPLPPALSPAVRRIVEERGLDPATVVGSGPGGRLLKQDVLAAPAPGAAPTPPGGHVPAAARAASPAAPVPSPVAAEAPGGEGPEADGERIVPMSRVRLRIAEKMVAAQLTAAILTTFNELDMTRVMETRARWKDAFEKTHGVRLGYMSFFARACLLALREIPEINGEIRGTDMVLRDAVHLGVATSTPRGLVVPIVRHAERLDFAGLEREVARMAQRARDAQLTPQELSGGTFTITNGGVFGSLLSTPILNPPQSAILGMHKIEKRAVVVDDAVVVRPMMYVALSYDHRLIDGQQAVTFLVRLKERLEDPERLMLAV